MKESQNIEIKLRELAEEKERLIKKLNPIPKGYYKQQFMQENATFRKVLMYQDKPITKEKLNEIRSFVIQENEPYEKRIREIDELIPILNQKLVEAKANELLEIPKEDNDLKTSDTSKIGLSEHGELKAFVEKLIESPEFIALKIPKHHTLKANHKIMIKKLLNSKYPDFVVNLKSFYTILRKLDYSKPRRK
jgi:hypothetical protein